MLPAHHQLKGHFAIDFFQRQRTSTGKHPIVFVLDHLFDPKNLGSFFRLGNALAIEHLYICGGEIGPAADTTVNKVARDSEKVVPFTFFDSTIDCLNTLASYHHVVVEITNKSIPYYQYTPLGPTCLIFGNEKQGVSQAVLDRVDTALYVPIYGEMSSMGVMQAASIVGYDMVNKLISQ